MPSRERVPGARVKSARRATPAVVQSGRRSSTSRRRTGLLLGALTVGLAVAVGLVLVGHGDGTSAATLSRSVTGVGRGLPPWPAPTDPTAGERAAGLVVNPMEGAVQHFHAHLDIVVNGRAVIVPAGLGINERCQELAELHTHDATGILHIESGSETAHFTLGQLFTEWGVRLDDSHLGGLTASSAEPLRAYVDGGPIHGDPARIELRQHEQITLTYGAGAVVAAYDFAAHGL